MNEKETGSFYTPEKLIEYMVFYLQNRIHPHSILEPSAGDGRFVEALKGFDVPISLVEFDKNKAAALSQKYGNLCRVICSDFIEHSLNDQKTYDLIIGNPPYIAKKNVPEDQYEQSEKIASHFNLEKGVLQNLWVSFVLSSIKLLAPGGAIFFVLPFEFLQVQYAEKLRSFLETQFNTIEIITFEERIFKDIEQDICLVYLSNEAQAKPYIQYTTLNGLDELKETFTSVIMRNKPLKKWSNCILNDEETDELLALAKKYPAIKEFGEISPGIVTGANSFFILSRTDMDNLHVPSQNILPIVTKSSKIPALLIMTREDFENTYSDKHRTHLLNLKGLPYDSFSKELKDHIDQGVKDEVDKGHKCSNRKPWYDVPIVKNGEVCFFKRYNTIPRVVVNQDKIHTTDVIYNIRFKSEYDPSSFAFCFYNSLTLALCEYYGRFYGGGVGELVPSEFKALALPYQRVAGSMVTKLDTMFREGTDVGAIIDYVDSIVLSTLEDKELALLQSIRQRYLRRRLKIY